MTAARFSARLAPGAEPNRLARLEAERRAAGRPLIDLTVSNPTAVGLDYPAEAIAAALADPAVARYEPDPFGSVAARAAVAADYARRGAAVALDAVALTASSSESYATLFKLLGDPGQAVLLPQPSYPLLDYLARLEGLEPRPFRLAWDGRWRIDFDSIDLEGAAAVCLVNPNNPTGSFVHADDLARLDALAAARGVALVVDQVFNDYAEAPGPGAVVEVAARPLAALTFCLGGLSKACGLPQMKVGWIALAGPAPATAQARARLELLLDTYLSVATPADRALPRLLALGAEVRSRIAARVRRNRQALAAAFGPGSPCTMLAAEAGWSAILRVPQVMTDEEWALALLREDDLLVQPGYFFELDSLGATLVVSLLAPPEALDEGARRIAARTA